MRITQAEREALQHYRNDGYKLLNAALRGIEPMTPSLYAQALHIDQVISRTRLDQPMTVYRGLSDTACTWLAAQNVRADSRICDGAFASTSKSRRIAENFKIIGSGKLIMRILLPKGVCALDMSLIFGSDFEKEVLLPRQPLIVRGFNSQDPVLETQLS